MRHSVLPVILLCLLLLHHPVQACGYTVADAAVDVVENGVPLLVAPLKLSARAQKRLRHRRRDPSSFDTPEPSCNEERAKLQRIFDRLVDSSKLDSFMREKQRPIILVECGAPDVLPIANATVGKVLKAPASLATLAANDDAIAAVLAHELAHLTLRHHERLANHFDAKTKITNGEIDEVINQHEKEADLTGLQFMVNAKYQYKEAIHHLEFVDRMAKKRLKTKSRKKRVHDAAATRIKRLQAQADSCGYI